MFKYKNSNKKNVSCCPMGTMHDGIIECYWFGIVKITDCRNCTVRKDKQKIKKEKS